MRWDGAALRRRMQDQLKAWDARHDWLSAIRQEKLATFVLVANVALFVLFQVAKDVWNWNILLSPGGRPLYYVVWLISLFLLVVASDLIRLSASVGDALAQHPAAGPVDLTFFDRYRKYPYYTGVSLNILSIAILVEETGGIIRSPFVPVMYALLLGGQQLGRYRNNSRYFVSYGVCLTLALVVYESIFGIRRVPPVPDRLQFTILAATFVTAALFSHVDKMKNYRGHVVPGPSYGAINLDEDDHRWRFELYAGRRFKLEPYLPGCVRDADASEAKAAFTHYVDSVIEPLEGEQISLDWQTIRPETRFVAKLAVNDAATL